MDIDVGAVKCFARLTGVTILCHGPANPGRRQRAERLGRLLPALHRRRPTRAETRIVSGQRLMRRGAPNWSARFCRRRSPRPFPFSLSAERGKPPVSPGRVESDRPTDRPAPARARRTCRRESPAWLDAAETMTVPLCRVVCPPPSGSPLPGRWYRGPCGPRRRRRWPATPETEFPRRSPSEKLVGGPCPTVLDAPGASTLPTCSFALSSELSPSLGGFFCRIKARATTSARTGGGGFCLMYSSSAASAAFSAVGLSLAFHSSKPATDRAAAFSPSGVA